MTLPRNYGADYIRSFESIYSELAAKHKVSLIPLLVSVGDDGRYMQRDGLHPNVEGNRRLAEAVFQALETDTPRRPLIFGVLEQFTPTAEYQVREFC